MRNSAVKETVSPETTVNGDSFARQKISGGAFRANQTFSYALKMGLAMSLLTVFFALCLAFFVVSQYQAHERMQHRALSETIVKQLAAGMVDPVFTEDTLAVQLHLNQLVDSGSVATAAVVSESGVLIASAGRSTRKMREMKSWIDKNQSRLAGAQFVLSDSTINDAFLHAAVALNDIVGAYAVISIEESGLGFSLARASRELVLAVVVIGLFATLAAIYVARLLARPVYRLLAISEAARSGRVDLIESLSSKNPMANEWQDIHNIYRELGKEVKSNQALESILQRFVASDVADHLLSGNQRIMLEGSRVEATVLFVDIVDFTSTAESMSPENVADMLNRYLEIFAACARIHKGTVDKFIGDAAMIVFGAPRADDLHRENALACAYAIQETARQINEKRELAGSAAIKLRVGVNTGAMYAGVLGSEHRMEFTVVGDAVNLASRLCEAATPGQVLLSQDVYREGEASGTSIVVETQGQMVIKGKRGVVPTYRLISAKTERQWAVRGLIEDLVAIGDQSEKSYD